MRQVVLSLLLGLLLGSVPLVSLAGGRLALGLLLAILGERAAGVVCLVDLSLLVASDEAGVASCGHSLSLGGLLAAILFVSLLLSPLGGFLGGLLLSRLLLGHRVFLLVRLRTMYQRNGAG